MSHELQRIPFHGTNIVVTADRQVALRPVCEAMGLDFNGQRQRLKRKSWAVVCMTPTTGTDGKTYEMVTIDRKTFTMWLATIDADRLKNENTREMVELFQSEAADALDKFFHEGGAINPRASEHQVNALIRQAQMQMELCQAAKGLIHEDHLEARARVVLARGLGEAPELDAERRPLYTSDFLKEKDLSRKRMQQVAGMFGKRVKREFIVRHGVEPKQYPMNLQNGQVRNVNAYTEADRDLLEQVWADYFEVQGALA